MGRGEGFMSDHARVFHLKFFAPRFSYEKRGKFTPYVGAVTLQRSGFFSTFNITTSYFPSHFSLFPFRVSLLFVSYDSFRFSLFLSFFLISFQFIVHIRTFSGGGLNTRGRFSVR